MITLDKITDEEIVSTSQQKTYSRAILSDKEKQEIVNMYYSRGDFEERRYTEQEIVSCVNRRLRRNGNARISLNQVRALAKSRLQKADEKVYDTFKYDILGLYDESKSDGYGEKRVYGIVAQKFRRSTGFDITHKQIKDLVKYRKDIEASSNRYEGTTHLMELINHYSGLLHEIDIQNNGDKNKTCLQVMEETKLNITPDELSYVLRTTKREKRLRNYLAYVPSKDRSTAFLGTLTQRDRNCPCLLKPEEEQEAWKLYSLENYSLEQLSERFDKDVLHVKEFVNYCNTFPQEAPKIITEVVEEKKSLPVVESRVDLSITKEVHPTFRPRRELSVLEEIGETFSYAVECFMSLFRKRERVPVIAS